MPRVYSDTITVHVFLFDCICLGIVSTRTLEILVSRPVLSRDPPRYIRITPFLCSACVWY
jgi:hypothetical protein